MSTETLDRLLAEELGWLKAALMTARLALGLDASATIATHDGRFVAPMHPANHLALLAEPELPTLLLPVDARAFFEPLPGWSTAGMVARLEASDLNRVSGIEAVERYYRLGAGVEGALSRLRTSLFATELQKVDAASLIANLRRTGQARTLNSLLVYLQQELGESQSTRRTPDPAPAERVPPSAGCAATCSDWVCRATSSTAAGHSAARMAR